MQTIKIVQKFGREYIPNVGVGKSYTSFKEDVDFVDEIVLIEANHIWHRPYNVFQKDVSKWKEEHIAHGEAMYVGNPFNESEKVPPEDGIHSFHFLTYSDVNNDFRRIILSGCVVYIMNGAGQTIDSFGC